jgi:hypothetical protein
LFFGLLLYYDVPKDIQFLFYFFWKYLSKDKLQSFVEVSRKGVFEKEMSEWH